MVLYLHFSKYMKLFHIQYISQTIYIFSLFGWAYRIHRLHICVTYSYADACRIIFNTIKTSGHSSSEKYTSHFIWKGSKGLRTVLLRVGDWTELQHIDPTTLLAITAFLFRSPGLLNRGPGDPASAGTCFSFQHFLSNWSELPIAGVI